MFQVLAFLLTVEGLFFFRFVLPLVSKGSFFDSSENVNPDPRVSEKEKGIPWLPSAWQNSMHLMANVDSLSLETAVIVKAYF